MVGPAFADESDGDRVAIHVMVNDDERNTMTSVKIDDEIERDFSVRADGVPCWVRLKAAIVLDGDVALTDVHATEWGTDWVEKPDGWAYLTIPLGTDEVSSVDSMFAVRDIAPHLLDAGDADFSEQVSAEAIQNDGHVPNFDDDDPWKGMYDDDNPPASSNTTTGPGGSTTTDTPMPVTGNPIEQFLKSPLGTRLAQTGDMLAPFIIGLTCLLAFSVIMLVVAKKRENDEENEPTQGE